MYEAKMEASEKPAVKGKQSRTPGLSRQSSATEL